VASIAAIVLGDSRLIRDFDLDRRAHTATGQIDRPRPGLAGSKLAAAP